MLTKGTPAAVFELVETESVRWSYGGVPHTPFYCWSLLGHIHPFRRFQIDRCTQISTDIK